jgi:hypothetical protein
MSLVENDGRVAPHFETKAVPFGTSMTFLPIAKADGIYLECACEVSAIASAGKEYQVTVETAGEKPQTETFRRPTFDSHKVQCCVVLPHTGRTILMHCGRDANGHDVMVMVTPQLVEAAPPMAVMPALMGAGMAMGHGVVPAYPPPPPMPTAWSVPMPVVQAVAQEPAAEPKLAKLMGKYRQACAEGDTAKARKLAERCMAIDPTCFGK